MKQDILIGDRKEKDYLEDLNRKIYQLEIANNNITEEQILHILEKISFYNWSQKKGYDLFEKFLEKYDDKIQNAQKIKVLFLIENQSTFKKYALKYYELFQNQLKKTVLIDLCKMDDTFSEWEAQIILDFKFGKDYYHATSNYPNGNTIYEFYQLFHHVTHFYTLDDNIIDWDNSLFNYMTSQELINIFKNSNNLNAKTKTYIIEIILSKNQNEESQQQDFPLKMNEEFIHYFLNYLQYNFSSSKNSNAKSFLWKTIEKQADKFQMLNNQPINIFDLSYLQAINQLDKIPKEKRKKTSLYLKSFQLFLETILKNFKEKIANEDLVIFEALFQRIIHKKNLIEILQINNLKSLYHYYKTDELISEIPYLTLKQIKQYNAKQYLQVAQNLPKKFKSHEFLPLIILHIFGYEFLQTIHFFNNIFNNINVESLFLFSRIIDKEKNYMEEMKKVLLEINNLHHDKQEIPLEQVLYIFDYLYQNKCSKITLHRIQKSIESLDYILFPNNKNILESLEKLNGVQKGNLLLEKVEGIKLYDKYRFRLYSSIPDIQGNLDNYFYQMVDLHDINIISNGVNQYWHPNQQFSASCLTPNGKASTCLFHGAINPNGRFFQITYQNQLLAYSWVWRSGDVLCFDNIEITKNLLTIKDYDNILSTIYLKVAQQLIEITAKEEKRGIKLVILGKNEQDFPIPSFDRLPKVNDYTEKLYHPNNSENLYLKDSMNMQMILQGNYQENLKTEDREPQYLYTRKKIQCFSDYDEQTISQKINSIYFDYCLANNAPYQNISISQYLTGYWNEDWFVGIKKDGSKEFYSCGNDLRRWEEAKHYISISKIKQKKNIFTIGKSQSDQLLYLIDSKNYLFDKLASKEDFQKLLKEKVSLSKEDYLHGTGTLYNFGKILLENQITSSNYGNHIGGGGTNGEYYVCVSQVGHDGTKSAFNLPAFILSKDILTFKGMNSTIPDKILTSFRNTSYPLRTSHFISEFQAFQCISLENAKGVLVPMNLVDISKMIYLQEFSKNNLPLICTENQQIIDKEQIKKLVKLK